MNIIKLNAIDSTNNYLKKIIVDEGISDYTVVTAKFQTEGKGQLGTKWDSEDSKNLICSVYKKDINIKAQDQFVISALVSLALIKTLRKANLSNLHIKWPNDIMSDNKKICGILIENIVKENYIKDSVIGIGLNVNQTIFNNLPNATSIKNLLGTSYSKDEILNDLVKNIEFFFNELEKASINSIFKTYEDALFRINVPSTFKNSKGDIFSGYIKGVTKLGKLKVMLEDNLIESYDLKEISMLN
ncbi:MAG TPA: biotin--[acetyl-CoA-carboxylase] ligase [Flavobacteriaceae bacterium]|nr:biotin--[acetyl-CoA-carboxylase] ligase [Flavobacteriaceae bacterium]|tara:strand:+ start:3833 stop:4564 length:732 start_codon:yes stop_codon:yes gene_type:complete